MADETLLISLDPSPLNNRLTRDKIRAGETEADPGTSIGRYVVLETIGRGGMGRVLRAYDPKLQREVALKVLRNYTASDAANQRMLREARAMAQLSHPNVVAVHDTEETKAGVVLVMEYVAGQALNEWLKSANRDWTEIIHHFVAAGRGVAAAHAAGLLHRDFKAANVLVASTGEIKVTDFGLARAAAGSRGASRGPQSEYNSLDSMDTVLTQVGVVVGTPRYMAPEQHRNAELTTAVDQYAFCVSLWHALVGTPPYRGKTVRALILAKEGAIPSWPTEAPPLPRRMVDAIRRGLSFEPGDRWPSLSDLLDELRLDNRQRHRRWLAVGALGVVAIGGAVAMQWSSGSVQERCSGAQAQLRGVWDDDRRAEVEAAMLGIGVSYAGGVWTRAAEHLDDYANEFTTLHRESCLATTVREEQSSAAMDLQMGCLHRAKVSLGAVTDVLASADAEVVRRTTRVLDRLPPLSRCADLEALQKAVQPPPPEEAEAVDEVRALLSRLGSQRAAGRFDAALETLHTAEALSESVTYEPLHTERLLAEGELLDDRGDYPEAEAALRRALEQAARWHQLEAVGSAAATLLGVIGNHQKRYDEALHYRELAMGLAAGDPAREARVLSSYAVILNGQGRFNEAAAEHRRALSRLVASVGPEHAAVGRARSNYASVLRKQGEFTEMESEYRQAVAIFEKTLGPDHPDVAGSRTNLGLILQSQGKFEEAETEQRRAVAGLSAALGDEHPLVALARSNLGGALRDLDKFAEAEEEYRRVVELRVALYGANHPSIARALTQIASTLTARGQLDEADAELRRALAMQEGSLGPDHPDIAACRSSLAANESTRGHHVEAEQGYRQALASILKSRGPEHLGAIETRIALALTLRAQGRHAEAKDELHAAVEGASKTLSPTHAVLVRATDLLKDEDGASSAPAPLND